MEEHLDWQDDLPPIPSARIWAPATEADYHAIVLGPWKGCWVHWVGKRSEPCLTKACPGPRHKRPVNWYAYTPIALFTASHIGSKEGKWNPAVISLGRENADNLLPHMSVFPGPGLTIARVGKSNEVNLTIFDEIKIPDELPPCPDVILTLTRLWGIRPPQPPPEEFDK